MRCADGLLWVCSPWNSKAHSACGLLCFITFGITTQQEACMWKGGRNALSQLPLCKALAIGLKPGQCRHQTGRPTPYKAWSQCIRSFSLSFHHPASTPVANTHLCTALSQYRAPCRPHTPPTACTRMGFRIAPDGWPPRASSASQNRPQCCHVLCCVPCPALLLHICR